MQGEADRALATQLGGIQATGSQQAYQQGQQAFTADQASAITSNNKLIKALIYKPNNIRNKDNSLVQV
jgi:regulatory protein YycI of two-component signal transduction system YycFG